MFRLQLLGPLHLTATDGTEVRAVLSQPKRLALLAYLAAAAPGVFHRRDTLLALFWPEATESQARLALRQALHYLRRALGRDVIANRGNCEIALAGDALWCDVVAFRQAMDVGEAEAALELYRGDLLAGFSISGISLELERWLEEERAALRACAASAAAGLSRRAAAAGDLVCAIEWARRELALSSDDEPVLRRLVRLLDRQGNRAGALRAAQEFARHTMQELSAELAAETKALVEEIRARAEAHPVREPPEPGPSALELIRHEPPASVIAPVIASVPAADGAKPAAPPPTGAVAPRERSRAPMSLRTRRRVHRLGALVASLLVLGGFGATVAHLRDGRQARARRGWMRTTGVRGRWDS